MLARFAIAFLVIGCSSSSENKTPGTTSGGGSAGTTSGGAGGSSNDAAIGGSGGSSDAAIGGSGGASDAAVGGAAGASANKIVFFTSEIFEGTFAESLPDATAAADALCTLSGAAIDPTKTWRAYLSTSLVDAVARVELEGKWYLRDQTTLVFPDRDAWKGDPLHAIDQDELGATYERGAWTGTGDGGLKLSQEMCVDWSADDPDVGAFGLNNATDVNWRYAASAFCYVEKSLYCFEL